MSLQYMWTLFSQHVSDGFWRMWSSYYLYSWFMGRGWLHPYHMMFFPCRQSWRRRRGICLSLNLDSLFFWDLLTRRRRWCCNLLLQGILLWLLPHPWLGRQSFLTSLTDRELTCSEYCWVLVFAFISAENLSYFFFR